MSKNSNTKQYDLEERTYIFARDCRLFVKPILKTTIVIDDCKQLIRASGSVAANYIEANESLSKKDFVFRIKICRKEAKESLLWLRLIVCDTSPELKKQQNELMQEAVELGKIFGAILEKSK